MYQKKLKQRRGITMPLLTVALVALVGLVALAVDIGRLAVAQTECQTAADSAAIVGARSLDGTQNLSSATASAIDAATGCKILGASIPASESFRGPRCLSLRCYSPEIHAADSGSGARQL